MVIVSGRELFAGGGLGGRGDAVRREREAETCRLAARELLARDECRHVAVAEGEEARERRCKPVSRQERGDDARERDETERDLDRREVGAGAITVAVHLSVLRGADKL